MRKILVVDDEEKIRGLYLSLLRQEGFEVAEAANAIEANERLKREKIDLILLDIKMPEVDGCVLHEAARLFHKRVKVIVASVYSVDEQRKIIIGAADYYDKSEGTEVLIAKVRRTLEENSRE